MMIQVMQQYIPDPEVAGNPGDQARVHSSLRHGATFQFVRKERGRFRGHATRVWAWVLTTIKGTPEPRRGRPEMGPDEVHLLRA
jgi:hypothetical protein